MQMATTSTQLQNHKVRGAKFMKKNEFQLWILCAAPIFFVLLFNYIPMFGIIIAFKKYKFNQGIFGSEWSGLKNFQLFFTSNEFLKITWNTLSLNFTFIVCGVFAALLVAILLFELKSRVATKIFQTTMITPHFLSWVIVSYMAYAVLHPQYGILNSVLSSFGFKTVDWYSKPDAWPAILTIASIWKSVGVDSVIYYAALMGIDSSLFEAADIDGASKWQKVCNIIIPSLVPLLIILTIMKIGGIFRADFGLFYQVTRDVGTLYTRTDVIDTYIFRTMRVVGNMGISTAVGLLQSVVGFVLVVCTNYAAKKIDSDNGLF